MNGQKDLFRRRSSETDSVLIDYPDILESRLTLCKKERANSTANMYQIDRLEIHKNRLLTRLASITQHGLPSEIGRIRGEIERTEASIRCIRLSPFALLLTTFRPWTLDG